MSKRSMSKWRRRTDLPRPRGQFRRYAPAVGSGARPAPDEPLRNHERVMAFEGFPAEAFSFYERLEADNTRDFWNANKHEYQQYVREPMIALADELEDEFGPATVFRPNRDIRFSP